MNFRLMSEFVENSGYESPAVIILKMISRSMSSMPTIIRKDVLHARHV